MHIIEGIPAAKGIAIGRGFHHHLARSAPARSPVKDTKAEVARLQDAIQQSDNQLKGIYEAAKKSVGAEAAEIFNAHRMMLKDPDLLDAVQKKIVSEGINAEAALFEASEAYADLLQNLADEYLQARAVDVRDVAARLIRNLRHESLEVKLSSPAIVFAEDLTPSDTIQYERDKLLGFFTQKGGATSHTAILSRALGIPAVVGAGALPDSISAERTFILDGDNGRLVVDPDEATLAQYSGDQSSQRAKFSEEHAAAALPAVTRDGKKIEVAANIGNVEDARNAVRNGAEGIGLFRTEFSYLEQASVPDEEALVAVYQEIFDVFGTQPVIVRTLDIGGDKEIPHLKLPVETNPFLGNRGIRISLSRPDLFRPQLRAILRAGSKANLLIMFPMIASVSELRAARAILNECMLELEKEKADFNRAPKIGVMIEVPSAVICADQLAKEVDFFSIGSNDLAQYALAADRTNANVAHLVNALQPAVLRLIKQVIDEGHKAGIWVGMCGEMAGDSVAIPILLGLGLDEFSMNPPSVPQGKALLRSWDVGKAAELAEKALRCETADQVTKLVAASSSN